MKLRNILFEQTRLPIFEIPKHYRTVLQFTVYRYLMRGNVNVLIYRLHAKLSNRIRRDD